MGMNDFVGYWNKGTFQVLNVRDRLIVGSQSIIANQGTSYFVDSGSGSDTNDGSSWSTALATLDTAVGKCTANQGDTIYIAEGHAEDVESASAITIDVAGINIIGLGNGADRPTFTFKTATTATAVISANSVYVSNIICLTALDSVVSPVVVSGANVELYKVEFQDTSSTVEAVRAILTTATADNLKLDIIHKGFAGDAGENLVRLVGANNAIINVNAYGKYSVAVVECHTTACSNVQLTGFAHNDATADYSKTLVDTVTGSTYFVEYRDGEAGKIASGADGVAITAI